MRSVNISTTTWRLKRAPPLCLSLQHLSATRCSARHAAAADPVPCSGALAPRRAHRAIPPARLARSHLLTF